MEKRDLTRLLGWPGYRVYRYEVEEAAKTLKIWVRKKPVHRGFECSGCGRRVHAVVATWEREVADLDCFEFRTTVVVEVHRLNCAECGPKVEKIEQVPSKAPYTRRFEDQVGEACESGAAVWIAGEHRARHRSAVSGTVGSHTAQGSAEATGSGRNLYGREDPVHYGGE